MEYENEDLFKIKPFDMISKNELDFVYDDMRQTILKNDLYLFPVNSMSKFIKAHFGEVWNNPK